tara:strand:+ start:37718 stop:40324 length:2607 start_codon:yes stop_codon:yes gene_type:complete
MKLKINLLVAGLMMLLISPQINAQNALHFDGVNDKVQTTYSGILGSSNRTFEAWIYLTATPTSNRAIMDYGLNAVGSRNTFAVNSNLGITYLSGGTNANIGSSINAVTLNQWTHVAFVLSGGTGYLYANGVQVGTGSLTSVNTPSGNSNLVIGNRVSGGNIPFSGKIDEVRVWNYAKTAAQIIADTGRIICPPRTGLVAYHNFDNGTAGGSNSGITTSADSSGLGNNGTLSGFSLTGSTSNWVTGKTLTACYPVCYGPANNLVECDGYSITVNGHTYSTTGVYIDTLVGSGCDSIIVTNLTINPLARYTQTFVECSGFSVTVGSHTYTTTGVYTDTLVGQSSLGCDSIVTTDLTVGNYKTTNLTFSECIGYSVTVGTHTYTTTGIYHDTLTGMATGGCDSIVNTDLTILNTSSSTDTRTACDSLTWIDGITYTANNTTAKDTVLNAVGCDSVITLNLTITASSTSTDTHAACDSYTWINGVTYTASNTTATHTLTNAANCDSVVTLNLTITNSTSSTDVITACGSYTWIDGITYTASNSTAKDTLVNAVGCDSIISLNLTINPIYATTDVITACDSYTWINGVTYTTNNSTAIDTLTSVSGCDSVVTLNLTINTSLSSIDVITACGSYTWIDGVTYTASNSTATDTLVSNTGCDSVVTLNLTINSHTTGSDIVTACDSLTWIDGITYYANNSNARFTLTNAAGCDSIVRLFLTISPVDVTTTRNGLLISANATGMTYQWIDCSDNSKIAGATAQSYYVQANGDYAVIVTDGGCSDTSDCVNFTNVGINEAELVGISVYPNPISDALNIDIGSNASLKITITNSVGEVVYQSTSHNQITTVSMAKMASGMYLVTLRNELGIKMDKVVKR